MKTNFNDFINEEYNQSEYLKWKRNNVTLRGVKNDLRTENGGSAMLGSGLYTASLSNKQLAKEYGKVYFVVNAIPKNPKVFNTLNEWEIWFYNTLVYRYSKEKGKEFPDRRDFNASTTIEAEIQKLGYDGVVIKGREMVNYTPPDNVKYFQNEYELKNYFEHNIQLNEGLLKGKSKERLLHDLNLKGDRLIEFLIKRGLYDILPRNEDGICIYNDNLFIYNCNLTTLPDDLTINGDLDCSSNRLINLPSNLIVNGNIYCQNNDITTLPNNLFLKYDFNCSDNDIIELPENLTVKDNLYCRYQKTGVKLTLPKSAKIGGKFSN